MLTSFKINFTNFLKLVLASVIIFAVIYFFDSVFSYGDQMNGARELLRFYFSPVMVLLDGINILIPIKETSLYSIILFPRWEGWEISLIGFLWTMVLAYLYSKVPFFKGNKVLKFVVFVTTIGIVCFLSYSLLHFLFGPAWFRVCPGCS